MQRMRSSEHPIRVRHRSLSFGPSRDFCPGFSSAIVLIMSLLFFTPARLAAQEPPPPSPPAVTPQNESSSQQKPTGHHSDDFLVRGTVFTPQGMALPGAELRIRRASEKKFRWQTVSNSRGEFAVRVKMGADYLVLVHVKGFPDQSQPLDAKTGERFKDMVFRMPQQENKKQ